MANRKNIINKCFNTRWLLGMLVFLAVSGTRQPAYAISKIDSLKRVLSKTEIHDTTKIKALNALAWEFRNTNPDTAITLSTQALKLAENIILDGIKGWQKEIGNAFNTLGVIHRLKGNYPKSLEYYHQALKLHKKQDDKKRIAATLGNIGLIYDDQGNYPKALEYYFRALKISKELGDKNGIAIWLSNIGIIYWYQDDYPKALEYYFKALKMDKELGDKNGIASDLGNIGIIYHDQGDYPKALEYYFKALKINKELGNKNYMASNLGNIGELYLTVYETLPNGPKGEEQVRDSLRQVFVRKHLLPEWGENPFSPENSWTDRVGEVLLDSAIAAVERSYAIQKEIGDKMGITYSLNSIGNILEKKGKPTEALEYFYHAYALADSIELLPLKKHAAQELYTIWKQLGNTDSALFWHERYNTHKDSLFNDEKQKALGKQEAKFEWQQKLLKQEKEQEKQEAIARERQERQQVVIYSVSGGLVMVLVFLGLLYNRFRTTRQQKRIIEEQKQAVDTAYSELHEKNKQITDSITYAQRIQQAVLVPEQQIKKSLPQSFTLLKPQSIVSGDFYYFAEVRDHVIISAIDCTGHGVPGAFMSLIGNDLLNQIVHDQTITSPAQILNELDHQLEQALRQETDLKEELGVEQEEFVRDGMDLAFCVLHPAENVKKGKGEVTLEYAGANNPLYVISSSKKKTKNSNIKTFQSSDFQLYEIPPDKQPIGKQAEKQPFTNRSIPLHKGDTFYIFSDGYPDQFGGPRGKKFMYKRFRELLLEVYNKPMDEQKKILNQTIEDWMAQNDEEQIDDICVMGIRV